MHSLACPFTHFFLFLSKSLPMTVIFSKSYSFIFRQCKRCVWHEECCGVFEDLRISGYRYGCTEPRATWSWSSGDWEWTYMLPSQPDKPHDITLQPGTYSTQTWGTTIQCHFCPLTVEAQNFNMCWKNLFEKIKPWSKFHASIFLPLYHLWFFYIFLKEIPAFNT